MQLPEDIPVPVISSNDLAALGSPLATSIQQETFAPPSYQPATLPLHQQALPPAPRGRQGQLDGSADPGALGAPLLETAQVGRGANGFGFWVFCLWGGGGEGGVERVSLLLQAIGGPGHRRACRLTGAHDPSLPPHPQALTSNGAGGRSLPLISYSSNNRMVRMSLKVGWGVVWECVCVMDACAFLPGLQGWRGEKGGLLGGTAIQMSAGA